MSEKKCIKCVADEPFSHCEDDPCTYVRPKPLTANSATKFSTHNTCNLPYTKINIKELINLEEDVVDKLFGEDRVETLNSLLSSGISIDKLGINNEHLMIWACKNGYPVLVKLLLDNGINQNLIFYAKEEAIYHAISGDCTHVVDLFIEYGFNQNMNMSVELSRHYVYQAILLRKPKMIKHLLHWGVDLKACGVYLLLCGQCQKDITMFKLLLSHGVTVESATVGFKTLAQSLIRYNPSFNEEEFQIFLSLLEREGAKKLEDYEYTLTGYSLLHKAAVVQPNHYLEHLLKQGFDPNIRVKRKQVTPLHFAAACNNMPGYQLLLSYGAMAEPADWNGNTPLHRATIHRQHETVRNLLLLDVRSGAVNRKGKTALNIALDNSDEESIEWLLLFGINVCEIASFKPDVLNNQKISYKLTRYVIKKRTAGMRVDYDILMNEKLCNFEERCRSELDKLKDLKILDSELTCYDLLRANKRVLAGIASNWSGKDLKDFFSTCVSGKFPIYEKMLWRNIHVGIRHAPVYDKAVDGLYSLIDLKLPSLVMEKLMTYLNFSQMENIIKSCQ